MQNKNILISGAGIAGPTLAYWLQKYGFNPTIVEVASKPRMGGYLIDFWGAGLDVAEKMNLMPTLNQEGFQIESITFLDANGDYDGKLNISQVTKALDGRVLSLLRSDLAKEIYEITKNNTEYIFGDSIKEIKQNEKDILVSFEKGQKRRFDLVVGADGFNSNVRNIVFKDQDKYEKYYGYYTAACTIDNYLNKDFSKDLINFSVPGKQLIMYSTSKDKITLSFTFRHKHRFLYDRHDSQAQKELLWDVYRDQKWEIPNILKRVMESDDFYFDSVSQIVMPSWGKGRVALLGDAAYCPSLLSGQGSALAMAGAYVLAGELKNSGGEHKAAFANYEKAMRKFVTDKQETAKAFASTFVPKSNLSIFLRNNFSFLVKIPFVANYFVRKFLVDEIVLKDYK